jgi:CelD/BcsL family acetyltransferase involved in cellulose biosynthesis
MSVAGLATADTPSPVAQKQRASRLRGPRFLVEVFDGADEALMALEAVQSGLASTGFQTLNWLTILFEELARSQRALPRLVIVTERNSGHVAMILPLIVKKKRSLHVARFADLGVSDYGAPILGPAALTKPRSIRRAWRAVRKALRDVDLIRLEKMPAEIAGRANPLVTRRGLAPSRKSGTLLTIDTSFDDYLLGRDEAFLNELTEAWRFSERKGGARFAHAQTPDAIARAYAVLEEQQAARHAALGTKYLLGDVAYRQFYERMVMDGSDVGLGYIFTLEIAGVTVATLYGILHDGTFTLLRLSHAGDAWKKALPGRLIVLEVMGYFYGRGIRRFDFGLGEHAFKSGFGVSAVPLYDLIVARDLAALPRAAFHRFKGRMRKNPRLRAILRRFRGVQRG